MTTDIKDYMAEGYSRDEAIHQALKKVNQSDLLYPLISSEYDEVRVCLTGNIHLKKH